MIETPFYDIGAPPFERVGICGECGGDIPIKNGYIRYGIKNCLAVCLDCYSKTPPAYRYHGGIEFLCRSPGLSKGVDNGSKTDLAK